MNDYKKMAAQMLFVEDYGILHYDFCAYLEAIADNTTNLAGRLLSRQVIALAIETWKRMNPDKEIIGNG